MGIKLSSDYTPWCCWHGFQWVSSWILMNLPDSHSYQLFPHAFPFNSVTFTLRHSFNTFPFHLRFQHINSKYLPVFIFLIILMTIIILTFFHFQSILVFLRFILPLSFLPLPETFIFPLQSAFSPPLWTHRMVSFQLLQHFLYINDQNHNRMYIYYIQVFSGLNHHESK